jgi:hypothetical protein
MRFVYAFGQHPGRPAGWVSLASSSDPADLLMEEVGGSGSPATDAVLLVGQVNHAKPTRPSRAAELEEPTAAVEPALDASAAAETIDASAATDRAKPPAKKPPTRRRTGAKPTTDPELGSEPAGPAAVVAAAIQEKSTKLRVLQQPAAAAAAGGLAAGLANNPLFLRRREAAEQAVRDREAAAEVQSVQGVSDDAADSQAEAAVAVAAAAQAVQPAPALSAREQWAADRFARQRASSELEFELRVTRRTVTDHAAVRVQAVIRGHIARSGRAGALVSNYAAAVNNVVRAAATGGVPVIGYDTTGDGELDDFDTTGDAPPPPLDPGPLPRVCVHSLRNFPMEAPQTQDLGSGCRVQATGRSTWRRSTGRR